LAAFPSFGTRHWAMIADSPEEVAEACHLGEVQDRRSRACSWPGMSDAMRVQRLACLIRRGPEKV
jgi:hypothetical protein